jgi:hypothetical protein
MAQSNFWAPCCGAVSLTFDDGMPSQRKKAIPEMDKRGLRGTFYLFPQGNDWRGSLSPWKAVAAAGHEIGNHTLSHLCPGSLLGQRGGLEDRTLEEVEADILAAQERLVEIAPHQKEWTFCYPCYSTFVGRGAGRQSYVPVIAKHFLAGRGGGEYGFGNVPAVMDLACLAALATDRMSGFEMIGLVEELTSMGQWVVLVFHEIDGNRLTVGSYDFNMLLNYLHRRRDAIWTAPVVEIARKIADFQASAPPAG